MARYFFDVHDSQVTTLDEYGAECADRAAVSDEALRVLCEIAGDWPQRHLHHGLRVTVRDTNGHIVHAAAIHLSAQWLDEDRPATSPSPCGTAGMAA
ncbi:DUF6894 family protein [Methylobacterium oxalidis]|uniref:DUF6894 domain-containing protein n=1 Tax=Methylobacterium oxalidis TaxID=944322 RepID=A0A512J5B7_9HYPH|nr:hypothetical protein [Methylobacterium oxalidis]GEP05145.1 hypothetical protein MOX02_31830 [Methylobacterium oxalidis]GJE31794.1 hypothetical protein LDDCCGHA_1974 [Methylobacterium oxalidis]GLS62563.1 hypothetical protein GCM10007888_09440 [Methylobacterium oxalidis]